jgi:hypothetical protein
MRLNRRQTLSGGIATLICFVLPDIAARPEVGRLTGRGNTANLKLIVQLKPDLIVDVGRMTDTIHFARPIACRVKPAADCARPHRSSQSVRAPVAQ